MTSAAATPFFRNGVWSSIIPLLVLVKCRPYPSCFGSFHTKPSSQGVDVVSHVKLVPQKESRTRSRRAAGSGGSATAHTRTQPSPVGPKGQNSSAWRTQRPMRRDRNRIRDSAESQHGIRDEFEGPPALLPGLDFSPRGIVNKGLSGAIQMADRFGKV